MPGGRWLFRAALRLVPREWREDVRDELGLDSEGSISDGVRHARTAAVAGLRLRLACAWDALRVECRDSLRRQRRSPVFTAAAVVAFALGVGANIAAFSVLDRMLLRPLPFPNADRLVQIYQRINDGPIPNAMLQRPIGSALHRQAASLGPLAQVSGQPSESGENIFLPGRGFGGEAAGVVSASANVLEVLDVRPVAGTVVEPTGEATVLLEFSTWQTQFGGALDTIGMRWGDARITGVLPPEFVLPTSLHGGPWQAMRLGSNVFERENQPARLSWTLAAVARLAPGATIAEARAEVTAIAARVWADAGQNGTPNVRVDPIGRGMFAPYRAYFGLVVLAVGLVLSMAIANLSTMLLARWRSGLAEARVRAALGASPIRVAMAPVFDALFIGAAGAVVSLITFGLAQASLHASVPLALRHLVVAGTDVRLLGATVGLALLAALIASLVPMRLVSRLVRLMPDTPLMGRSSPASRGVGRTLLAIKAALAVVIVAGALASSRSFVGLLTGAGFEPADLYEVALAHGAGPDGADSGPVVAGIVEALASTPGVAAAGLSVVGAIPVDETVCGTPAGLVFLVSDGSLRASGTPLLAGRGISQSDVESGASVVVINRSAAAQAWPAVSPAEVVGRRVTLSCGEAIVAGVAADLRRQPGRPARPEFYVPASWPPASSSPEVTHVALRMAPGLSPDVESMREALEVRFPPAYFEVFSMADRRERVLERPRFQAVLFDGLAGIALFLAAVGLFALTSLDVAARRRETGVRIALGAGATDIGREVVGGALRPVLVGVAAGLVVTWWAAQFLQAFLFEVDARDPWTYALVALVLVATAVVASWLPARRAAKTDPASVLRAV